MGVRDWVVLWGKLGDWVRGFVWVCFSNMIFGFWG